MKQNTYHPTYLKLEVNEFSGTQILKCNICGKIFYTVIGRDTPDEEHECINK